MTRMFIGSGMLIAVVLLYALVREPTAQRRHDELVTVASDESGVPVLRGAGRGRSAEDEPKAMPAVVDPRAGESITCSFVGKVVDPRNASVARARVNIKLHGIVVEQVETDDQGAYSFTLEMERGGGPFRSGTIVAEGRSGGVGHGIFEAPQYGVEPRMDSSKRLVIKPVSLRHEANRLTVRVSSECKGALPARVWIQGETGKGDDFSEWTDADGHLRVSGLRGGAVLVVAASQGCGRASKFVWIHPKKEAMAELELSQPRTLTIAVLEQGTRKPIEGARVYIESGSDSRRMLFGKRLIPTAPVYVVDDSGHVDVTGLGARDPVRVRVVAKDFAFSSQPMSEVGQVEIDVPANKSHARIELEHRRTIRWLVRDAGHGVPSSDAIVSVHRHFSTREVTLPKSGTMNQGDLVVSGWRPGEVLAQVHVQGMGATVLRAKDGAERGEPIAIYPPRRVTLRALERDGTPATGIAMRVQCEGCPVGLRPHALTDQDGIATLKGLYGGAEAEVDVFVARTLDTCMSLSKPTYTVDLEDRDASVVHTMAERRKLRIELTVDGAAPSPHLSGHVHVQMIDRRAQVSRQGNDAGKSHRKLRFNLAADDGLEFDLDPPEGANMIGAFVQCVGYLQDRDVELEPLLEHGSHHIAVNLCKRKTVEVTILPSPDPLLVSDEIRLERFDGAKRVWIPLNARSRFLANVHMLMPRRGRKNRRQLMAGRYGKYRVVDLQSATASKPFNVGPSRDSMTATLDLRAVGTISGRVIVPNKNILSGVRILVVDRTREISAGLVVDEVAGLTEYRVNPKDGTFAIPIRPGESLTIRADHASLRPQSSLGSVKSDKPMTGIVLQLIE